MAALIALRQESWLAIQIGYASAAILITTKYYFIISFPEGETPKTLRSFIPLFITLLLVGFSFMDGVFASDLTVVSQSYILISDGPYASLYMLSIFIILIIPIINLYRKLHDEQYQNHIADQIRFLFLGVTFFFIIGFATNSILPVVFDIYYFNGVGPSLALILAGIIFYIINKHNFLGLSIIVQRGFIYSILLGGITAVYLAILFILESFVHQAILVNSAFSGLLTSVIGIFSFSQVDTFLRRKTDRFFFKDRYDPSLVLDELSEVLNRSIEISRIKLHVSKVLQQALKASAVQLEVHTDAHAHGRKHSKKAYVDGNGALIAPLVSNKQLVGRLSLQPKRSGEPYSTADQQFITTLSYQLALACERALLHQQLQDYSKELEYKVQQRTNELHTAHQNQQHMVSQIAHGLQTPLTIITNELDTLKTDPRLSDQAILLERSLSSLSMFIYDLLKLSQLETSSNQMKLEVIDLSDLLKDMSSFISVLAQEQHISFTSNITAGVMIRADTKRIEEMLHVIIGNAMKYLAPDSQRSVYLGLTTTDTHATITVTDSGIGIPDIELSRIFDRFYRAHNARSQDIPGSGLGLSIAKTIVTKHGGEIAAYSTVGVGTTFSITLPRHTGES